MPAAMISSPPPLTSPEKSPSAAVRVSVLLPMPSRPDPESVVIEVAEMLIDEMSSTPLSTTPADLAMEADP